MSSALHQRGPAGRSGASQSQPARANASNRNFQVRSGVGVSGQCKCAAFDSMAASALIGDRKQVVWAPVPQVHHVPNTSQSGNDRAPTMRCDPWVSSWGFNAKQPARSMYGFSHASCNHRRMWNPHSATTDIPKGHGSNFTRPTDTTRQDNLQVLTISPPAGAPSKPPRIQRNCWYTSRAGWPEPQPQKAHTRN